jgi:hypothetical protein
MYALTHPQLNVFFSLPVTSVRKQESRKRREGGYDEEDSVGFLLCGVRTYVCFGLR